MTIQAQRRGVSLIEAVVYVALFTVLSLAIMESINHLYRVNSYAIAEADEIDNARRGLSRWSRDVREMVTAEDGTYPLAVMEPNQLGYYGDTDQDSAVEYVEYVLDGTTLTKKTYDPSGMPPTYNLALPSGTEVLSRYIQNNNQATSTFFYYDAAGNQTTELLLVRYITMQLIVNIDTDRSPGEFMLRSAVAPRNIKDNL